MARPAVRILGVDTALRCTGLGVVSAAGVSVEAVEFGLVRNPAAWPHTRALRHLQEELAAWMDRHEPEAVAVEGVFYCRNARTALALGEARGVVLAACAAAGVPVFEYAPRTVKQAVVGWGAAGKEQVGRMVVSILGLPAAPPEDAADALAVAICHWQHRTSRRLGAGKEL